MRQNLGEMDRTLRFALAFWWLGPWSPQYDFYWANVAILIFGWIALIESFAGWCGIHHLFHVNNKNQ